MQTGTWLSGVLPDPRRWKKAKSQGALFTKTLLNLNVNLSNAFAGLIDLDPQLFFFFGEEELLCFMYLSFY